MYIYIVYCTHTPKTKRSTIIVRADPGTFDILQKMHCKSVKMEDI